MVVKLNSNQSEDHRKRASQLMGAIRLSPLLFILIGIIFISSCSSINQNYKRTQGKDQKYVPRYR